MAEIDVALAERVRERLTAYIHPNAPSTAEQRRAFEAAVLCQAEWEAENGDGLQAVQRGVQRLSVGSYSETYFSRDGADGGFGGICPDARAMLFNAGLLRRGLPCARRI